MSDVDVEVIGLDLAMRGTELPASLLAEIEVEIGEVAIGLEEDLRGTSLEAPGMGLWPVGTIINEGSREYYTEPDSGHPDARRSGRSLQAWNAEQDGMLLRIVNDAVDGRGNSYAEHVHHAGGAAGDSLQLAEVSFRERADNATERITELIADQLGAS